MTGGVDYNQPPGPWVYATPRWRYRIAPRIRSRDGYRCRRCGKWGNQVDHIVSMSDGGDPWDEANLQTLCLPCHNAKTHVDRRNRAIRKANVRHIESQCDECRNGMQWHRGSGTHRLFS